MDSSNKITLSEYRIIRKLMGSVFELIVHAVNEKEADRFLQAGILEIERIENLLTEFKDTSEISRINQNAGIKPVKVSEEVYGLLSRCRQLFNITQGAFDITIAPLKKLYDFRNHQFEFPSKDLIKKTMSLIGSGKMVLQDNKIVFLPHKGMKISLAAIGKGYAADVVKKRWISLGVTSGVINASGDLTVIGQKESNKPWIAGIPEPDNKKKIFCYVPLFDTAIATSGDYEQFFIRNGIRYSHTIDPRKGLPLNGIKSVSVVSNSGELSDALATAVYVMGRNAGLHFIEQVPGTHCLVIDENNKVWTTQKLEIIRSQG